MAFILMMKIKTVTRSFSALTEFLQNLIVVLILCSIPMSSIACGLTNTHVKAQADHQVQQPQPRQDLVGRSAHHQQVIFRETLSNLHRYVPIRYLFTLLTTFFLSLPVSSNGQCSTTYEVGTPKKGAKCVFPFKWKSQSFSGCTGTGDPEGKMICEIRKDF